MALGELPEFRNHKKTQNAYKRTKIKNMYKKHLRGNINKIIEIIVVCISRGDQLKTTKRGTRNFMI